MAAMEFGADMASARPDVRIGSMLAGLPRVSAALDAWRAANPERDAVGIRITARRDGFRRCGMAHTKAPVDHPAGRFSPAELEALLAEPNLTVELV